MAMPAPGVAMLSSAPLAVGHQALGHEASA